MELTCVKRNELGSQAASKLRKQELIPAVVYGGSAEPVHLAVMKSDLPALLSNRQGEISLKIGGSSESVVLKDIQYDAMGDEVLHADFLRA